MNSLKCMKARSLEVLKGFVESQQSESGSQMKLPESSRLKLLVVEAMEVLGRAAAAIPVA